MAQIDKIVSIHVVSCEGAPEVVEMVSRVFATHPGWAGALAAVKRDAEDYLPGLSGNKMEVHATFGDGSIRQARLNVVASTQDPFPSDDWSW
jgi:hypothetical protein